jgi:hypothetical protein
MRRLALLLLLILVAAAVAGVLWARTYTPLSGACCTFGPSQQNLGALVDPVSGSGGKTVFFPKVPDGRDFTAAFDLSNTGRVPVRVKGLVRGLADVSHANIRIPIAGLELTKHGSCCVWGPKVDEPFHPFTLKRHAHRLLVVHWRPYCSQQLRAQKNGGNQTGTDTVQLRYGYLGGLFSRTQVVELPFAVTVQCGGTLPASTR